MTYCMKQDKDAIRATISNQRRRRKRNRPQQQQQQQQRERNDGVSKNNGITKGKSYFTKDFHHDDDDTLFAFIDKDGDDLLDGKAQFRSLPLLLEERRRGRWRGNQTRWQSEMLFNFTKKPVEKYIARRQWRSFATNNQKIPFTQLGSPPSDAVLALERRGDYVLSLGTTNNDSHTGLALRFYVICSTSSRKRQLQQMVARNNSGINRSYINRNNTFKAPLLQTTPLHHGMGEPNQRDEDSISEDAILNLQRDFSPSTTPVELLISKDWKVGVALLHPSTASSVLQINTPQENSKDNSDAADQTASMVFFTLPRRQLSCKTYLDDGAAAKDVGRIFEFSTVTLFSNDSRRKFLWCVECIPNKDDLSHGTKKNLYNTYFRAPGYLLFNDEGDGFRLTWASEECFLVSSVLEEVLMDSHFVAYDRDSTTGVNILSQQNNSWVETRCDGMTGESIIYDPSTNDKPSQAQVGIVNESFLHIDVLLAEILSRRKGMSETHPDFCYSLISVNHIGRIAEFVIVFTRKKKSSSLGVFVKIDLFCGLFVELDWVQSKGIKDTVSLQKWCNKLALNRRMKEMRAGPFSVEEKNPLDWTRLSKETFGFDNDEEDDYDESYWRDFVQQGGANVGKPVRQAPKLVTLSSLYPCCDIITNYPIISCDPVMSIRAKDSPIQLAYA
jgi:hypothetical protein